MNDSRDLQCWSITQAHRETGISREELYRLCRIGALQSIRTGDAGKIIMIRAASLVAYLTGQRQPTEEREPTEIGTYRRQGERRLQ